MRLFSVFVSVRSESVRRHPTTRPGRLGIEALEDRTLPASVTVVPITFNANNSNTFHTLEDALTAAGNNGTITIEPGAVVDTNTDVTQSGLTIQGDPNVSSSILPAYNLSVDASGVQLKNMNLNFVSIDAGFGNISISKSTIGSVFIQGGDTGNGNNLITQNLITSTVTITGNTNLGVATNDTISNNNFVGFGNPMLSVTADNGAVIQGNTFTGGGDITTDANGNNVTDAPQTAVAIFGGVGVTVENNTINLQGKSNPAGVTGSFTAISVGAFDPTTAGLAKGTATAAPVVNIFNNDLATVKGIGLDITAVPTSTGDRDTQVKVQGNDFHNNAIGVRYTGNMGTSISTDLGGGILGSIGGNDFRGFASKGNVNNAAIVLTNVGGGTLSAKENMFAGNGQNAGSVVFASAGTIDTSAPLTNNQAFVQVLYNQFLGRTGTITELNGWVNTLTTSGQNAVVQGIYLSTASLDNIVSGFYLKYLGRAADASGEAHWVGLLQTGASLESIQAGFISSAEFISDNNSDYVQGLYRTFFGRTGSAAELAYWYTQLQQPNGLNIVANGFAASAENRSSFVQSIFSQYFHRTGSASEVSNFANQPGSLLGVAVSMLDSTEFFNNG